MSVGSSPHTRGAHRVSNRPPRDRRIIPAYAGSTSSNARPMARGRDHPRIRGEHGFPPAGRRIRGGSSPHTRGAPGCSGCWRGCGGIIPAYAGSTAPFRPLAARVADHPRIRGEHVVRTPEEAARGGSSPHTRGAPENGPVGPARGGIIPAYAGSTGPRPPARRTSTDHPRIRGEHQIGV